MSINIDLLASFASATAATASGTKPLHQMTVAEARKDAVKFEDRTRESGKLAKDNNCSVTDLSVQNIAIYVGKTKIPFSEIENMPNTKYLEVPKDQVQTVVEQLQLVVDSGQLDNFISDAIDKAKASEQARVAKAAEAAAKVQAVENSDGSDTE